MKDTAMITIRKAADRGHFDHGWLDTWHTFSFADYFDPDWMEFRALRVINDDRVQPGQGFGMHPHRDMEILTVVLEGALEHKDSMGNTSQIRAGEVQRMTAGTGVLHSEYNPSKKDPVHLYQIWIQPEKRGLKPGYEQKLFPESERRGRLRLVASRDGRDGSLTIHQDTEVRVGLLANGDKVTHGIPTGRHAWVQIARGAVTLNGKKLSEGDGAAASGESMLEIVATEPAEIILFDLA
jgi:redox-sensitive bicupin YhaK (pirin superfamily)